MELYLSSIDVYKCTIRIEYENMKNFVIFGDYQGEAIKEEKEENSVEIDKEIMCWDENSKKNVVFFCKY